MKEDEMKKIAIIFPGIGYHADKPLLYFAKKLAKEAGYECIDIAYTCKKAGLCGNEEKIKEACLELYVQAKKQLSMVDFCKYDSVLFISKSIGTAIATAYAREFQIECKNIFYTPIEITFENELHNGIAFTGTKDQWVDSNLVIRECKRNNIPLMVIKDVNHSLECDDAMGNLNILRNVMEETRIFLSNQ